MSSPFSPVRRTLAGFLLALAVAALAGCAAPQPAATTAPGTPAPAAPSAEPTPSATPTASPSPTSTASAAALPYCGDEFIVDRSSIVWWMGTQEEQLAQAAPEPGFVAAEALAGLDVVCAITYRSPTDGEPGVMQTSEAFVASDGGALEQLEAWAAANGYVAQSEGDGFQELHQPPNADGTTTRKIFFAPLDGEHPPIGDAERLVALTGAPPDAIYVWHADFTVE
ncbi:hypothetical protein SAMN04487783_0383 [Agrococcus baldri]|uniref:Lipoprotein n=1 Tax=Agrococcus baldri TaxID=153730 RepID=A0AA94HKC4_9MICO|nr:hypothetical protein [Agrococcus baldri]SFR99750.1 hypothetical protein SAMN04487783_0383 [Agrococcus baldri]